MKFTIWNIATLLFCILILICPSCNSQSNTKSTSLSEDQKKELSIEEVVSTLDKATLIIFQDSKLNHWFSSDNQGVYRYDGKTLDQFTLKDGLAGNGIRDIQEDKKGNLYFDTGEGISKFDGQFFTTLPLHEASKNDWKLEPDDLWFAGDWNENGVYRYDGQTLYHLEFPKHHLEDEFYAKYPNASFSPYDVYCIYKDSKGNVWFGTSNFGLCRYDGKSLSWMYEEHLTTTPAGGAFCIRSIVEDAEGFFWICNNRYRYKILPNDSISNGISLIRYQKTMATEELVSDSNVLYFMSMVKDDQGDVWMATYEEGVWQYNGKALVYHPIPKADAQFPVQDSDANISLFSIYKDNQGVLWLGTHNNGAYRFNGKSFERFTPLK